MAWGVIRDPVATRCQFRLRGLVVLVAYGLQLEIVNNSRGGIRTRPPLGWANSHRGSHCVVPELERNKHPAHGTGCFAWPQAMGWTPPHPNGIDVPDWKRHQPVAEEESS